MDPPARRGEDRARLAHPERYTWDRAPPPRWGMKCIDAMDLFEALGEPIRQADLARALALLAERGPDTVYKGAIGEAMVRAAQAAGGVLTMYVGGGAGARHPRRGRSGCGRLRPCPLQCTAADCPLGRRALKGRRVRGRVQRRMAPWRARLRRVPGYSISTVPAGLSVL